MERKSLGKFEAFGQPTTCRNAKSRGALAASISALPPREWRSTMRTSHSRMSSGEFEVVSGAWALIHALEHLREHMGHAQLTRQLWEHREA